MNEILLLSNPSKRRKGRKAKKAKRKTSRRRSARRSRTSMRVSARRNPSARGIVASVVPTVKAGALGAVGGVLNDLAYGFGKPFLPGMMQAGMGRHATKILSAVLVGIVGNMVLRGKGTALAHGAATVAIHEALKEQIAVMVPSLPLGALDEAPGLLGYGSSGEVVSGYEDDGDDLGAYVSPGIGMGAYVGDMDE